MNARFKNWNILPVTRVLRCESSELDIGAARVVNGLDENLNQYIVINFMKRDDVNWLLDRLDGSGSDDEYDEIKKLRALGEGLPALLLEKYRNSKKWGQRASCVYNSIRYARHSQVAVDLGIEALIDKSYPVRYRACMLLAYSLNLNSLSALRVILDKTSHQQTKGDLLAAIDAIKSNNSNYFLDRDHSGNVILRVN